VWARVCISKCVFWEKLFPQWGRLHWYLRLDLVPGAGIRSWTVRTKRLGRGGFEYCGSNALGCPSGGWRDGNCGIPALGRDWIVFIKMSTSVEKSISAMDVDFWWSLHSLVGTGGLSGRTAARSSTFTIGSLNTLESAFFACRTWGKGCNGGGSDARRKGCGWSWGPGPKSWW